MVRKESTNKIKLNYAVKFNYIEKKRKSTYIQVRHWKQTSTYI